MPRNPFHFLYVGERVSPEDFTDIFSTELVQHALPLFQPGHVVLTGANGMGKSMLFHLFRSAVRIAYEKAGKPFPVPGEAGRFVAAGINVNTARCNEFGNRRTPEGDHVQELMFGDFFNYVVCLDMLRSIEELAVTPAIADRLGISMDDRYRDEVAKRIASDPVWMEYLTDISTHDALMRAMERRVLLYRRYMNANDASLDLQVANTKTSAGEPMKAIVRHLRECKILPPDLPFYVLVDQYEELATIASADGRKADYRSVVNKVLNSRDPTLSYRIGTRGYGWRDHINVFGTDARLEQERDYKLVELEARLRRSENGRSIFADFARDVFRRRIEHAAKTDPGINPSLTLTDLFGKSRSPADEARIITGDDVAARRSIVKPGADWPWEVASTLLDLAEEDPLSARLGEAWLRQKGAEETISRTELPWERKPWWKKERTELALLQIAGDRRQRAVLAGEEDIVALSGGNILIFLSICQLIWDFAVQASRRDDNLPEMPISWELQTVGIIRAGRTWLDRITSEYGRSGARSRLVQKLGEKFADILLSDRKMSNPGQNGISLAVDELDDHPEIKRFLIEAVDYGNLVMTEHANRSGRARRRKFYLNPLYCPIFRIPFHRTKEPLYLQMAVLEGWLAEAKVIERSPIAGRREAASTEAPLLDLIASDS